MASNEVKMKIIPDRANFQSFALLQQAQGYFALGPAYQSYNLKRSTNSATILLLGQTGSGKSHTINNIFNKTISPVGESISCSTKEIVDFSIRMPSEDLKIANSQVHIIDTPGFGDTSGGIEFDAKVLANIRNFFQAKSYFPNFILLTLNINDTRLEGKFAPFIKLLQAVRLQLIGTVLDKENPNLIVILTHHCGALPKLRRDPRSKIVLVQKLIQENLGIFNVPVEVAENQGEENELDTDGEYFILPNNELFPRNIYLSMIKVAKDIDPIGHGIINEAYKKLQKQEFEIYEDHRKIEEYAESAEIEYQIMRMQSPVTTEVGDCLQASWVRLDMAEKNSCRMKPPEFALKLSIMGIKNLSDVPRDKKKVMEFFRELLPDAGMEVLLRIALGLEPSKFLVDLLVGKAYNITTDKTMTRQLFHLGENCLATIGCYVPECVKATVCPEVHFTFNVYKNQQEMVKHRLHELKIQIGDKCLGFNFGYRNGFNVSSQKSSNKLTAVYQQNLIKLECDPDTSIHPSFKTAVGELPNTYDKNDTANVQKWKHFFDTYGTHYISTAYIGGSIIFEIDSSNTSQSSTSQSSSNFEFNAGGLPGFLYMLFGSAEYKYDSSTLSFCSNLKNKTNISIMGGNTELATKLLSSETAGQFLSTLKQWEISIYDNPSVCDTSILLGEVADIANKINPNVLHALKNAQEDLYQAGIRSESDQEYLYVMLEYEPPPPLSIAPPTREKDSENNKTKGDNCVTGSTLIFMANNKNVPICLLKPGDEVLNRNGNPVKVIGVNKVYTMGITKLYGFDGEPFFTSGHTFLSPKGDIQVVCKSNLEELHPQMKTEFSIKEMTTRNCEVMAFDDGQPLSRKVATLTSVAVEEGYELYFLAVQGDGTYIANGFVCYHELPNFTAWPKAFEVIYETVSLLTEHDTNAIYDFKSFKNMCKIAYRIKGEWECCIKKYDEIDDEIDDEPMISRESFEFTDFAHLINNGQCASLGMMLYSLSGKFLHEQVDLMKMGKWPFIRAAKHAMHGPND